MSQIFDSARSHVYVWGSLSPLPHATSPTELPTSRPFKAGAFLDGRTLFLTESGELFESSESGAPLRRSVHEELAFHSLQAVAGNGEHAVVLTEGGVALSFGSSDEFGALGHGLLGRLSPVGPRMVVGIRRAVVQVSCGFNFSLFLCENAQIFATGLNNRGQLGIGSDSEGTPQLVNSGDLCNVPMRQISAGNDHVLALSISGQVFAWGSNRHGKLGLSLESENPLGPDSCQFTPRLVSAIEGGVTHISAGLGHSAVVVRSRELLVFGDNRQGQCGFDAEVAPSILKPVTLSNLPKGKIRAVKAANAATLVAVELGDSAGRGANAFELVTISANATSWHVPPNQRVVGLDFGKESGGLFTLEVPEDPRTISAASSEQVLDATPLQRTTAMRVPAFPGTEGGIAETGHLFSVLSNGSVDYLGKTRPSTPLKRPVPPGFYTGGIRGFGGLSIERLDPLVGDFARASNSMRGRGDLTEMELPRELITAVTQCLKEPVLLAASFLYPGLRQPVVATEQLVVALEKLESVSGRSFGEFFSKAALEGIAEMKKKEMKSSDQLRPILVLMLLFGTASAEPVGSPRNGSTSPGGSSSLVYEKLAEVVYEIPAEGKKKLIAMIGVMVSQKEVFTRRLVDAWRQYVERLLRQEPPVQFDAMGMIHGHEGLSERVTKALVMLEVIFASNAMVGAPDKGFQFDIPSDPGFVLRELRAWKGFWEGRVPTSGLIWTDEATPAIAERCLVVHKRLVSAAFKQRMLANDNRFRQQHEEEQLFARQGPQIFLMMMQGMTPVAAHVLEVRRERLVEDTVRKLSECSPAQLRLPLKIKFQGEEGVDEGGVIREFFGLLSKELFNPVFGMFSEDAEARTLWFVKEAMQPDPESHSEQMFWVIGRLVGLAIYNNIPGMSVPLPLALFKKLLGQQVTLDDLLEIAPAEYRSIQAMLDWEDDSTFADTFAVDFSVSYEYFGARIVVDLKPDGRNIPVEGKTKREFIDLYLDWLLNKSVASSFSQFQRGFREVCVSKFMYDVFSADDLKLLVCGESGDLDFAILRENAKYESGYSAEDPYMQSFWRILQSFDDVQKRKFLTFVTGSDRVPLGGLQDVKITVQKNGAEPTDHLPTAYTCYNVLLLPKYLGETKLRRLLLTAIENAQGFGLR